MARPGEPVGQEFDAEALAFDRRTAFLFELGVAFIASSLLRFDILLLSVLLVRGIAASLFFFNRKHPRQMLFAGVFSGVAGIVAYVSLREIFEGRFAILDDLALGMGSNLIAVLGGAVVASVIAMFLRELAERTLGHVSRDQLLDLTDLEQPLLRKMAAEAPGSFYLERPGELHFARTGDEPAVIQITGYGPTGTEYAISANPSPAR